MFPSYSRSRSIRFHLLVILAGVFSTAFFLIYGPHSRSANVAQKRYRPELVVQDGHKGDIKALAFSPDGKLVASGGADTTVKLWDVETGKQLRTLIGHEQEVTSIAFSPDGKMIASGGGDLTVRLWDVRSGDLLKTLFKHLNGITSVAFSPDGKYIVSGSEDSSVKIWDIASGADIVTIGEPYSNVSRENEPIPVTAVAISPDGKLVAAGDGPNSAVTVWDWQKKEKVTSIKGKAADQAHSLHFTPDGRQLLVGSQKEMWLLDIASGHAEQILSLEEKDWASFKSCVSLSPDGKTIAAVDESDLTLMDLHGKTIGKLKAITGGILANASFSRDGKSIATGGKDVFGSPVIKIWNVADAIETKTLEGYANEMFTIRVSPDGRSLAEVTNLSILRLWKMSERGPIRTVQQEGQTFAAPQIEFSSDSRSLLMGAFGGSTIFDRDNGSTLTTLPEAKLNYLGDPIAYTPDAKAVALSLDTDMSLWDVRTGKRIRTYVSSNVGIWNERPNVLAIDPQGRTIAGGDPQGRTRIWDIETGNLLLEMTNPIRTSVQTLSYSADGKFIAIGGAVVDTEIRDVSTGTLIKSLKEETVPFGTEYAEFSPDSRLLAGIDFTGAVRIWDVESGNLIQRHSGLGRASYMKEYLHFSPNGKLLFATNGRSSVSVWNVADGRRVATLLTFGDKDWAVVTPDGLFDASEGAQPLMHFVVSDPDTGYETISLDQLKSKYFVPGLLEKILSGSQLPNVGEFSISLSPNVVVDQAKAGEASVNVSLLNRGGGIGRVEVHVNDSEFIADARSGNSIDTNGDRASININIPRDKLRKGGNTVEIIAWNQEGNVRGRPVSIGLDLSESGLVTKGAGYQNKSADKKPSDINLYAIVSGVSDYAGESLDLRYAAKDAEDMSKALSVAARRYFCSEEVSANKPCTRVHIRLLSTEQNKGSQFAGLSGVPDLKRLDPVKSSFADTFAEVAKNAKQDDVVLVYFSGHATSITSEDAVRDSGFADTYLYATRDAVSIDQTVMSNRPERERTTVSSLDLAKWLSDIKADKKILILDTCAAGAAQNDLMAQARSVDPLLVRSIDRLQERTGFYVLMGSAADAVSYEANEYRQGLLTYSLLSGMTVDTALRDGRFLDVENWFNFAEDKVEDLAKGIGGVQRPSYFKSNQAKSFDIGRIDSDELSLIPIAQRVPLIIQPELREAGKRTDRERLTEKVEQRLLEISQVTSRGAVAINYIRAANAANGYSPRGEYTVNGDQITVDISLVRARDEAEVAKFTVTANAGQLPEKLVDAIAQAAAAVK